MNYYELLGLPINATQEEISKAYKKAAKQNHPDLNRDNPVEATEKFRKVVEAYETLSDFQKRAIYNAKLPKLKTPLRPGQNGHSKQPLPPKTAEQFKAEWAADEAKRKAAANLARRSIYTPPPPKFDIWGQPIEEKKNNFKDCVKYEDGFNPDIR